MNFSWQDYGIENGYQIFTIIVALSVVARVIVKVLWYRILPRLIAKTSTTLDDKLIAKTARPAANLALLIGLYAGMEQLTTFTDFNETRYFIWIMHALYVLTVATVTLLAYSILQSLADWYMEAVAHRTETNLDKEFLPLIRKVSGLVLFFIALTIVLKHFGQDISALIATASVASLAVALAAQETLANMISGLTIMADRPFRLGDRIELENGRIGDVVEIGLRTTKIRGFDNNVLVIPNKDISASRVINWGYPNPRARIRQVIGVAYGSDVASVKRVLVEVMSSHPKVLQDPAPAVYFEEFGQSSLNLAMICWVDHYNDAYVTRDELNMAIDEAFRQHGIKIAFPQQDVNLKSAALESLVEKVGAPR